MAELSLDGVTKRFGDGGDDIIAVDDASLDIDDGEFLVLVGPSGCGKSTTLRMIAGLESVSSGTISLDGTVIDDRQPADRDIAMVFQSYALYPHMTVRENMSFGLEESTEMPDDEIRDQVESAAEMMGIEQLLDRTPSELSGGQQQRVALGRAIVRSPAVFLMDEPLSNLDAKLRSQMRTELQRMQEDLGVTTVYVTHDQTEAMTMGDRIAILDDGRLQQVATPLEAYHEPANRFVAGFIGEPSMNFFETTVENGRLVGENFDYPLSEDTRADIGDTADVTLGVRPEDIELVDAVEGDGEHDFRTVVDVVEPVGSGNNVYLAFEGDESASELDMDESRTFVATIGGLRRIEAGQPAIARLPEDAIHLFDGETGEALHNRNLDDAEQVEPQL
ncbi:carbohydrate ABC transporter ATP-binding protein, cut1 family [Halococcus morrhuae DSM 1307]|uniref:ABC-type D-xylose/L-arabinose transporter n=1 Tax=Halococcus morrhuae DSM 1307 TaxID=931277 RepID=M0MK03_HALMO|nr:ABC transporter ATP-binding protein [Halococcus morrhuae]EMA45049.1 carbohydrate ABC transporter ATP-binding protein, cut1 family [Halococcus morrhuae DSM 1307]